tara:strand:- start:819 stop:986 length:168 start_codon:yes stop_codon:yes gene_type:complete
MKNLNTVQQTELDAILDSEDFKNIFDIEKEKAELAKDGWTIKEAREFAQFLIKTK